MWHISAHAELSGDVFKIVQNTIIFPFGTSVSGTVKDCGEKTFFFTIK